MKDTELYAALLKLGAGWVVREVRLDVAAERVDVWIEEAAEARWSCPECGQAAPVYDHAEERQWRHLDTCECRTYLHTRLPRVECPQHGIRQVQPTGALPGSHFSGQHPDLFSTSRHQCYGRRTEQQDPDGQRNGLRLPQSGALQDRHLLSLWRPGSLSETGSIRMNGRLTTTYWGHPLETRKRQINK